MTEENIRPYFASIVLIVCVIIIASGVIVAIKDISHIVGCHEEKAAPVYIEEKELIIKEV